MDRYLRPLLRISLCTLLCASLLAPKNIHASGNGMGVLGTILGGGLIIHGVYQLTQDFPRMTTSCGSTPAGASCPKDVMEVGMDLLEIAGGAMALASAMQNESETRANDMPMPSMTPPGGGPPGGPKPSDIPDLCAQMPQACRVDPNTNRPALALPPKSEMMAALSKTFEGQAVNADGLSLEEALSDLDNKYDQAAEAVAAFNGASNSGAFDSAMNGDADLGTTAQGDGDPGDGEGLNRGRGVAGAAGGPAFEPLTLASGQTTDWASLLNKTKAERGGLKAAKAMGLNLEDAQSGRILSIWERVTRAIRGSRDRDILLAKVEWTRKQAAKNVAPKQPNVAISTEKK